jgi:hypothetical protein
MQRNVANEYYGTSITARAPMTRVAIVAWKAWARLEGRPT